MIERSELHELLKMINEWLRFAEAKNAVMLGMSLSAATAMAKLSEESSAIASWSRISFILFMMLAAATSLVSFFPQLGEVKILTRRRGTPDRFNPIFFGSIARVTADEYATRLLAVLNHNGDFNAFQRAYIDQIKVNGTIAQFKFECFTLASKFAGLGFVSMFIYLLALVLS